MKKTLKRNTWKIFSTKWLAEIVIFIALSSLAVVAKPPIPNSLGVPNFLPLSIFSLLYLHTFIQRIFLLPLLFDHKQIWKFGLFSFFILMFFSSTSYWLLITYIPENIAPPGFKPSLLGSVFVQFIVAFCIATIYFIQRNYRQEKQQVEARLLITKLEINQLRAQLNPHFLFNTLNNLYGVSLEEPSRAPELIMQLSQLMRFQVEAAKNDTVPLSEELEFLENYVSLEKERVGQRCKVYFEKNIGENDLKIAPLLLLPLVENAFKFSTPTTEPCFVKIKTILDKCVLDVEIENSIPSTKQITSSTGTGLNNTQQRLERIYPKRYTLKTSEQANLFHLHLQITLQKG